MSSNDQTVMDVVKKYKYAILVLFLLPLVFAVISYMNVKNEPARYSASIQVTLGQSESDFFTDTAKVKEMILSSAFLKDVAQQMGAEPSKLQSGINVVGLNDHTLDIQMEGTDKTFVTDADQAVVNQFFDASNQDYQKRLSLVKKTIARVKDREKQGDNLGESERLLYDLKGKLLNWKQADVAQPLTVSTQQSNPLVKGVATYILAFGLLVVLFMVLLLIKNRNKLAS